MKSKVKELKKLCDYYNLNLRIQYYGDRQVCFLGMDADDDDEEIFCISIWYNRKERRFYLRLDSEKETYRNNGAFSKEEILLMLSFDDFSDDELGIKPYDFEELYNEKDNT